MNKMMTTMIAFGAGMAAYNVATRNNMMSVEVVKTGGCMLHWAAVFLVIALLAALFGFGGIAAGAAGIAKVLFVLFIILALVAFVVGRRAPV
jgi:uncharacterized membrane protein YtjA (UPF0391 family)